MPGGISPEIVRQYFQACVSRDPARIGPLLDDDVRWACWGPVELLPYCGEHRGKTTVLDTVVRLAQTTIRLTTMELDEILIDGDRAATFSRLSAIRPGSERVVSFRCAQFLRFSHGKLIEFRALIDSFDAAEQMLGHRIEVTQPDPAQPDNVFTI
jgi:ketosteroid isomerase-like protein